MQWIKSFKVKDIIISLLVVGLVLSGSAITANAAQNDTTKSIETTKGQAGSNSFSAGSEIDPLKAFSIIEINRYLSQMDAADVATVLKLMRVNQLVKTGYVEDISTDALMGGALKGAVNAIGDPYSVYMDDKMYKDLMLETKGSFGGVGIILGSKDKILTVVAPIEGTPADKAGIASGDQILKIDGSDTKDMALDEAVNLIRGPEDTQVTLTINRNGQKQEYTIVRSTIQIKSISGKLLEGNIGYIRLSVFNQNTGDELAAKLQELEDQGVKALVLDLRNNPGGLLEEGVKTANNFVPKGPIVSIVTKDGNRQTMFSNLETPKYPLVVLVNGGSASASEIVAGAVQDTGAGTLIGTKTFGKGLVQSVIRLDDNTALKLTIAKYYTPNDRCINGTGIEPDIKVEIPDSKEKGNDLQLEKAIEFLKEKLQPVEETVE